MNAEHLVELLAQKNLVSEDLVAGLRQRIVDSPQPIPAEAFAERLVQHGVLTPSLADALLRQLRRPDNKPIPSAPTLPPAPASPSNSPTPSLPFLPLTESESVRPQPTPLPNPVAPLPPQRSAQTPAVDNKKAEPQPIATKVEPSVVKPPKPEHNPFFGPKDRFAQKKIAQNPWDSKLVLFGGSGLFVLFLLGFFFAGSLFQRSADVMFSNAEKAYDNGSYPQAIVEYTDFLTSFPNHSNASTAKIRRALARIRLNVDAKSDWSKTLDTARTELAAIDNEPDFYEETKSELAILLPKAAVALGNAASEKSSSLLADHAEATLVLIDKYLPKSLQPIDQLNEVRAKIERIRRGLIMQDKLADLEKKLEPTLKTGASTIQAFADCESQLDAFVKEFPEAQTDSKFVGILQSVSKNAFLAVEPIPQGDPKLGSATHEEEPEQTATKASLLVSLTDRNYQKDAPNVGEQSVLAFAEGTVFALRAADGTVRWRKTIESANRPDIGSELSFQAVPPTRELLSSSVLLIDSRLWTLKLLDAESGKTVWNYRVGVPFRLSNIVAGAEHATAALATETGEIRILAFGKDVSVQGFQLPQPVDSQPMIDTEANVVYQFADRNTLYVLSLTDPTKNRSIYTAHRRGEIRTVPILFGTNLLTVMNNSGAMDSRNCTLKIWDTTKNFAPLSSIPIRGLVDSPPQIDGSFAALTSDLGETFLFELVDGKITKIAEGSLGGETASRGTVRYVALIGKTVWTADWQLMRFETQLAQSRLLPKDSVKQNITTLAPLRRLGRTLYHVYRNPVVGGVFVEAVSAENASVLWETEVSERIVLEPTIVDGVATACTSSGKAYRLKLDELKGQFVEPSPTRLPRGTLNAPLAEILPLRDGFQAWIAETTSLPEITAPLVRPEVVVPGNGVKNLPQTSSSDSIKQRTIMVYDPTATDKTRFRTLLLPKLPASQPIALDGEMLVPLSDGQIALYNPKTLTPSALPFVASMAMGRQPIWVRPVALANSKEFVIADNRPDEAGKVLFYRIALAADGEKKLTEKKKILLDRPLRSPMATAKIEGKEFAVLIDDKNTLQLINVEEMKLGVSENLPGPCLWGPFSLGDSFVLATPNQLCFVGPEGKRFEIPAPQPIGKPLLDGDNVYFNSSDGKFWSVNVKSGKTEQSFETGVRASVGIVRDGKNFFCSGRDGAIFRVTPQE